MAQRERAKERASAQQDKQFWQQLALRDRATQEQNAKERAQGEAQAQASNLYTGSLTLDPGVPGGPVFGNDSAFYEPPSASPGMSWQDVVGQVSAAYPGIDASRLVQPPTQAWTNKAMGAYEAGQRADAAQARLEKAQALRDELAQKNYALAQSRLGVEQQNADAARQAREQAIIERMAQAELAQNPRYQTLMTEADTLERGLRESAKALLDNVDATPGATPDLSTMKRLDSVYQRIAELRSVANTMKAGAEYRAKRDLAAGVVPSPPQAEPSPPPQQNPSGHVKEVVGPDGSKTTTTIKPVAPPANGGPHGKVIRTGTAKDGTRVAQYEDGYIGPLE